MDESLEWLIQNTEDQKSNRKGTLLSPHTHSKCD